jgi:hypothetical protein
MLNLRDIRLDSSCQDEQVRRGDGREAPSLSLRSVRLPRRTLNPLVPACCRPAVPTHLKKAPSLSAPLPRPAGGRDHGNSCCRSHKVITTTAAGPPPARQCHPLSLPATGQLDKDKPRPRVTDSSSLPGLRPVRGPAPLLWAKLPPSVQAFRVASGPPSLI